MTLSLADHRSESPALTREKGKVSIVDLAFLAISAKGRVTKAIASVLEETPSIASHWPESIRDNSSNLLISSDVAQVNINGYHYHTKHVALTLSQQHNATLLRCFDRLS